MYGRQSLLFFDTFKFELLGLLLACEGDGRRIYGIAICPHVFWCWGEPIGMVKLQAATVSNRVVHNRKRKRVESDEEASQKNIVAEGRDAAQDVGGDAPASPTTTTTIPTKTHDGGKKPRRTPKKDGKPALKRQGSSTVVETSVPWPEYFTRLSQTHKALNLVYTFCCTRKHLATTFETIKSAVEANTNGSSRSRMWSGSRRCCRPRSTSNMSTRQCCRSLSWARRTS